MMRRTQAIVARAYHSSSLCRAETVVVNSTKAAEAAPAAPITPVKPPVQPTPVVQPTPTPVASQPTQQATVIAAREPVYTAPKSSLRSRLAAFCVGAALAGGVGYYRLQSDIWASAAAIESQIAAVGPALARSEQLEREVAELRARVQKLESSK